MDINIPYNFEPRDYQVDLINALDDGYKKAFCLWHRRAGKDITLFNIIIKKALEKSGVYFYFLPTFTQAKRVIWDGITNHGQKFINYIPKEIIRNFNNTEMKVELINGSIIQLVGTDRYDSIRGTNPVGCIFSEYAFQNPMAYEVVKPILRINEGFVVFNTTPNGRNHAFDLWTMAQCNDEWFTQKLTVADTRILTEEDIQKERAEGMDDDMIQQEYYCSFEGAVQGSYYGPQIRQLNEENRLCVVPYENNLGVETFWDLGINDTNAIWFVQKMGKEVRIIDYYENQGEGVGHYLEVLRDKGYKYDRHYFPHDIEVREYTTGKTRKDTLIEMGLDPYTIYVVPKIGVQDGIEAARRIFNRCWFDKEKTAQGIRCLQEYRKEYDDKRQAFRNRPLHNWASNGADAFRYLAVALEDNNYENDYDYQPPVDDPYY